MKRRKSPPEKNALSYELDRISRGAKAPHTFRRSWPRKKAKAQRAYRHGMAAEVAAVLNGADAEALPSAPGRRRRVVKKWGAPTLREWVARRQERRRTSHGRKARGREHLRGDMVGGLEAALRSFVRDARPPAGADLSDVVGFAQRELRYVGEFWDALWQDLLRRKPEWVSVLRAWRTRVLKERERNAQRRRTRRRI